MLQPLAGDINGLTCPQNGDCSFGMCAVQIQRVVSITAVITRLNGFMPTTSWMSTAIRSVSKLKRQESRVRERVKKRKLGGRIAQLLECWTEKPDTIWTWQLSGAGRDFYSQVSCQCRLSYSLPAAPHVQLLVSISVYVNPFTDPACKLYRLKAAQTCLQTVYFPIL